MIHLRKIKIMKNVFLNDLHDVSCQPQHWQTENPKGENLTLVMNRENAKLIKDGVKNVEFRALNGYYFGRVFDKKNRYRKIETLTFRNYNKTFELKVKVERFGACFLNDKAMSIIEKEYPQDFQFNEFSLNELREMVKINKEQPKPKEEEESPLPEVFFFVLGDIVSSEGI